VDDSLSVRKTLTQLLVDAGYDVRTARDGFDALDALAREKADIVLTDLEMPNLNGLDLTRRLRQSETWRELPVIMITSRSTDKHRDGAQAVGVSAYLSKPYGDAELLGKMRALLAA
jgi:chemosensory pili system protein ChpA (sensor histidine kinase/response regulator)